MIRPSVFLSVLTKVRLLPSHCIWCPNFLDDYMSSGVAPRSLRKTIPGL